MEEFRQLPENFPKKEINANEAFTSRFVQLMLKQYKTIFQTNTVTNAAVPEITSEKIQ